MSNMELEMKIKNVNEKELVKTIEKLGGTYLCTAKQFFSNHFLSDFTFYVLKLKTTIYRCDFATLFLRIVKVKEILYFLKRSSWIHHKMNNHFT